MQYVGNMNIECNFYNGITKVRDSTFQDTNPLAVFEWVFDLKAEETLSSFFLLGLMFNFKSQVPYL